MNWIDVQAQEWKKENLAEWAQDTFMTESGKYQFDWEKIREEGGRMGLAEYEIGDVIDDLQRIVSSKWINVKADSRAKVKPGDQVKFLKPTTFTVAVSDEEHGPVTMDLGGTVIVYWHDEPWAAKAGVDQRYFEVEEGAPGRVTIDELYGTGVEGVDFEIIPEGVATEFRAEKVTAADPLSDIRRLVTDIPEAAKVDPVVAHDYAAKIRDQILSLMETEQQVVSQDQLSEMLGVITSAAQKGQETGDASAIIMGIEKVRSLTPGFKPILTSATEEARKMGSGWLNVQKLPEGLSIEARIEMWRNMAFQAMTGYTDSAGQARAAYLMGQYTHDVWKKCVADIKKHCGEDIEHKVKQLTKWGTLKAGPSAIRDVVQKVLQSKNIYPYPELVMGIIDSMKNPLQERGLGAETAWPITQPR